MANSLELNPQKTALVVIDLQKGIAGMPTAPHSAADVIRRTAQIADHLREVGGFVVLVHVGPSPDGKDALHPITDNAPLRSGNPPADWDQFVPEMTPKDGDHVVRKRQWGAFYGTDLDLQLRRRGIDTIILTGIATNIGVESTARDAYERGYQQIFVEDACSDLSEEAHAFAINHVLARIGRVRSTDEVLKALSK
ncbi:hydrolase [Sulfobacillus sp. DSM 109850]|uniref:Hydrolase n=1 Tax=Sulfobacillus harzensis TaxID=2729629 RepID=A0A7Y0Q2L8_9FIRM|nr:hydrolase [Sulfobacillus harzensis]